MRKRSAKALVAVGLLLTTLGVLASPASAASPIVAPGVVYVEKDSADAVLFDDSTDPYNGALRTITVPADAEEQCDHGEEADDGAAGTGPDEDGPWFTGGCVTVALAVESGILDIPGFDLNGPGAADDDRGLDSGAEVSNGELPGKIFNIFGTIQEVNDALDAMTYDPDQGFESKSDLYENSIFFDEQLTLEIRDGHSVILPAPGDEDGNDGNNAAFAVGIRVEQFNDGPTLTNGITSPVEVAAGGPTIDWTDEDPSGDPAVDPPDDSDVELFDPDIDSDELDDYMLVIVWLDGEGLVDLSPIGDANCLVAPSQILTPGICDEFTLSQVTAAIPDAEIDAVAEPFIEAIEALLPDDLPADGDFANEEAPDNETVDTPSRAFAFLADSGDDTISGDGDPGNEADNVLDRISYTPPATGDHDVTLNIFATDLGGNGLPIESPLHPSEFLPIPDPGFALTSWDIEVRDEDNDAPVVTPSPAGPTELDEQESATVSFTVTDPDAECDLTLTSVTPINGVLTSTPPLPSLPFDGTPEEITALLANLTFTASDIAVDPTQGSVSVHVEDNGCGPADHPEEDPSLPGDGEAIFTIHENPDPDTDPTPGVNDPPVVTVPEAPDAPLPATEGALDPAPIPDALIGADDPDAGPGLLTLTITLTGDGQMNIGPDLIPSGYSDDATLTEINTQLDALAFRPALDADGDDEVATIQITVNDNGNAGSGGAGEDTESFSFAVTDPDPDIPVEENDPPTLTLPASIDATEGTAFEFVDATIGVADPDVGTDQLTITITPSGGTTNQDGVHTDTLDDLNTLLDGLTFTPANDPDSNDEVLNPGVTLTVNDNGHNPDSGDPADEGTATASAIVNVDDDDPEDPEVNDPPELTVPASIGVVEGTAFPFVDASIGLTDPDAGTDQLTLTITSTGGTTNQDGAHTDTLDDLNTLLDGLTFTAASDADSDDETLTPGITITVNDNGHNPDSGDPADEGTDSATVDVEVDDDDPPAPDVNDPPELTVPASINVVEGVGFELVDATIGVTDADAGTDQLSLTITPTGGTTNQDGAHTDTLDDLNTLLDGLTFTAASDADFDDETLTPGITITVNDNGHNPDSGDPADEGTDTATIDVNVDDDEVDPGTNDAPTIDAPDDLVVVTGGQIVFTGINAITIDDPDAGSNDLLLEIDVTGAGSDVTAQAVPDTTGTLVELQELLDGLVFTAGSPGAASITLTLDDQGNSGSGGPQEATATIDITVTAAQDPGSTTTTTSTTLAPGGGGGGSTSTTSTTVSVGAGGATQGGSLPRTGSDLLLVAGVGFLLFGAGSLLADRRRRLAPGR